MVCRPKPNDRKTSYLLDHVTLDDHTQMTGTFTWTYDTGKFENGVESDDQETNLSPIIPAMIKNRQVILNISLDSPNKIIPRIATPTAPIPVQTA